MNRKILIFKRVGIKMPTEQGCSKMVYELQPDGCGTLLAWGVDTEENWGSYSTGIVEMPDGSVRNVDVNLLRFEKGE